MDSVGLLQPVKTVWEPLSWCIPLTDPIGKIAQDTSISVKLKKTCLYHVPDSQKSRYDVMGQLKTLGYTILDESLRQDTRSPLGHEVPPPSPLDPGGIPDAKHNLT